MSSKSNDNIDNFQMLLERESQDIISKGLERHKYTITVIVIGPCGVGKSSLIERIINDSYSEEKNITVGVDSKFTTVDLKNHSSINYHYYDTNGQEIWSTSWTHLLPNADIIIFVNENEETNIKAYTYIVEDKILLSEKKIICCINKSDLISDAEKEKVLNNFKLQNSKLKDQPTFLVSAKTNEGIKELTKKIKEYSINIIDKIIDSSKRTENCIDLKSESKKEKKCC